MHDCHHGLIAVFFCDTLNRLFFSIIIWSHVKTVYFMHNQFAFPLEIRKWPLQEMKTKT